tara:strand:- start:108 stop:296 length:189 start_codon:yes stop_codon:yes gene_type:complete
MAGTKIKETIELNADTIPLIEDIVEKYKLRTNSKAFRVLLDYISESEDHWDIIFKKRRCKRC